MAISEKINKYIEDSKVNGKFLRWDKPLINVCVTPITSQVENKEYFYSEIKRGVDLWNRVFQNNSINIQFNLIQSPQNADIVIHWVKVGRVFEGMCKYPSIINGVIKKVSIDIGLPNSYSPKVITNESIFATILHELGHSLGLGHGVEIDDAMFVPHQKNIQTPSENDIYVLKTIYK